METAAYVLLIIVSSVLSIFLIVMIIAMVYFIKFLRRADDVAEGIESAIVAFKRSVTAAPFIRAITNIITKSKRR